MEFAATPHHIVDPLQRISIDLTDALESPSRAGQARAGSREVLLSVLRLGRPNLLLGSHDAAGNEGRRDRDEESRLRADSFRLNAPFSPPERQAAQLCAITDHQTSLAINPAAHNQNLRQDLDAE